VISNVEAIRSELLQTWHELPPHFITSSETKLGREDILQYIKMILAQTDVKEDHI
jgi:GTP-binding protein